MPAQARSSRTRFHRHTESGIPATFVYAVLETCPLNAKCYSNVLARNLRGSRNVNCKR
jgi:hypothetical protein